MGTMFTSSGCLDDRDYYWSHGHCINPFDMVQLVHSSVFHNFCIHDTRRSTTGYAFTLAGGAIAYRSKTQSLTATSSCEAEFYAAVTAAKVAKYLRSILQELGFTQKSPTLLYEDNASTIKLINAKQPTERSRHIDIQFFAIQDWKSQGHILMEHIPGIINPSDDLTKPLGWVLHSRHARRIMGHFLPPWCPTSPLTVNGLLRFSGSATVPPSSQLIHSSLIPASGAGVDG